MDKQIIKMPEYLATRYQAQKIAEQTSEGEVVLDWNETKFISVSAYDGLQQALGRRFTHIGMDAYLSSEIKEAERVIALRDEKLERGEI